MVKENNLISRQYTAEHILLRGFQMMLLFH